MQLLSAIYLESYQKQSNRIITMLGKNKCLTTLRPSPLRVQFGPKSMLPFFLPEIKKAPFEHIGRYNQLVSIPEITGFIPKLETIIDKFI